MLEELKQLIINSKWEEEYKKKLIELLPLVKENYLKSIYLEMKRNGSQYIGESLSEAVSKCVSAQQQLQNGQEAEAVEVLTIAPDYAWWDNGNFVFGWYLDLKQYLKTNRTGASSELHEAVGYFGVKMMSFLKTEQVADLLQYFMLTGVTHFHMLMELKVYIYRTDLIANQKVFAVFIDSLSHNEEIIGKENLFLEDKEVPPAVKNWIKDFYTWAPKGLGSVNTFQIVQYSKSAKSFNKLTSSEKELVLEILKIYVWLLNPNVSQTEIDEFLDFKKSEELKKIEDEFNSYKKSIEEGGTTLLESDNNTFKEKLELPTPRPTVKPKLEVVEIPKVKSVEGDIKNNGTFASDRSKMPGILKKTASNFRPGLTIGGGQQISPSANQQVSQNTSPSPQPAPVKVEGGLQGPDIDKKLEELEKRVKPVK